VRWCVRACGLRRVRCTHGGCCGQGTAVEQQLHQRDGGLCDHTGLVQRGAGRHNLVHVGPAGEQQLHHFHRTLSPLCVVCRVCRTKKVEVVRVLSCVSCRAMRCTWQARWMG
jgi:hypothetical protein